MTFLTDLSRLREAATKGSPSLTDEWLFVGDNKHPIANFNFGGSKKADREFLAYLVNHSEAIGELVMAAEEILEWHPKMFEANKLRDAIEKLNRSENES